MKKEQFVKVPFKILEQGLDSKELHLWILIKKFPKGNGYTNGIYASMTGYSIRTVTEKIKSLKKKGLVKQWYKPFALGGQLRYLQAIDPQEPQLETYDSFYEKEVKDILAKQEFPLTKGQQKQIDNRWKKLQAESN